MRGKGVSSTRFGLGKLALRCLRERNTARCADVGLFEWIEWVSGWLLVTSIAGARLFMIPLPRAAGPGPVVGRRRSRLASKLGNLLGRSYASPHRSLPNPLTK